MLFQFHSLLIAVLGWLVRIVVDKVVLLDVLDLGATFCTNSSDITCAIIPPLSRHYFPLCLLLYNTSTAFQITTAHLHGLHHLQ